MTTEAPKPRITITAWLEGFGITDPSGNARKRYAQRAKSLELDDATGLMTVEFDEPDPRIERAATKKEA